MDGLRLQIELYHHLFGQPWAFELVDWHFHDKWLSPVRDQGKIGACTFVACVSCFEMIYRSESNGGRTAGPGPNMDYFDLNEMFDNIFRLSGDDERFFDTTSRNFGASIPEVLAYINVYGLVFDNECRNSRSRNLHSFFCTEVPRTKLLSFRKLDLMEVYTMVSHTPIIATVYSHKSLYHCHEIIYGGPTAQESAALASAHPGVSTHSVLILGCMSLMVDRQSIHQMLVIQNSWGESFGFEGFVIVPLSIGNTFFLEFWLADGIN